MLSRIRDYFMKLKNCVNEMSRALMSLVSFRRPREGGFLPSIFWMYLYSISDSSANCCCVRFFLIRSSLTRWENLRSISVSVIFEIIPKGQNIDTYDERC